MLCERINMLISSLKSLNFFRILKITALCGGLLLICFLGFISYNLYAVQEFHRFFNSHEDKISASLKQDTVHISGWHDFPITHIVNPDLIILDLGKISSFTCRKLLQIPLPFPHQFWINNQPINSQATHLCGYFSQKNIVLQIHKYYKSFLHLLYDSQKCLNSRFQSLGICNDTCVNYKQCQKIEQQYILPTH